VHTNGQETANDDKGGWSKVDKEKGKIEAMGRTPDGRNSVKRKLNTGLLVLAVKGRKDVKARVDSFRGHDITTLRLTFLFVALSVAIVHAPAIGSSGVTLADPCSRQS